MWNARNKNDLIIEVWEKLDCESVGADEIRAIEVAVEDVFGKPAVDSPMTVARLLADEGAELRHSEIMSLHVERAGDRPYDASFRNLIDTGELKSTLRSIRDMENLRRKFVTVDDTEGLRLLRQRAISEKESKLTLSKSSRVTEGERLKAGEIAEWFRLWIQSPEVFENW
ncbi:MAG TPA: hypothetical protein VJV05_10155, partial [Pyrinomonadaceae bacterium]|nr:hypothetical protein [Pyrinomonadaceae bacterium]